jgi:uncharacterized membrane protein YphA (DoxX/SURF4 family)
MRLVAGAALVIDAVNSVLLDPALGSTIQHAVTAGAGILLFLGLWTPIAGALVAIFELWAAFSHLGDLWMHILLATLGAALALLGPGAWSGDARLFGWKRIDLGDHRH